MAIISAVMVIVGFIAFVAAGWYFQYRLSGRRMWSPLWAAFSFTAAALLFLITGVAGYALDRQSPFAVTGEVIWSQVTIGLGAAAAAAVMWTLALRRMSVLERRAK